MAEPLFLPISAAEAKRARTKNIVEVCVGFSAMTRVFAKGSEDLVLPQLEELLASLGSVKHAEEYERLHAEFCDWFTRTIRTAPKQYKNGGVKPSCACSYGQAAKVLDVAAKVYVHYCGLPSPEIANRLALAARGPRHTDDGCVGRRGDATTDRRARIPGSSATGCSGNRTLRHLPGRIRRRDVASPQPL